MTSHRFAFRFDPVYERAGRLFGITPQRAWVEVDDAMLRTRFGHWQLSTPTSNISDVAVTGPYRFFKTAGPARLGVTDLGLTFATNGEAGVLISFHRRVRGIDPLGLLRHGELTVTVEDVTGLAAAVRSAAALPPTAVRD
jgi:hypothetical protein